MSSSLLFSTQSAQLLPLISSTLLFKCFLFFFSNFSLRSLPLRLSLVSSWTSNICLEMLCHSYLLFRSLLCWLPSSNTSLLCPLVGVLFKSRSCHDSWLRDCHESTQWTGGCGGTAGRWDESIEPKSLDLMRNSKQEAENINLGELERKKASFPALTRIQSWILTTNPFCYFLLWISLYCWISCIMALLRYFLLFIIHIPSYKALSVPQWAIRVHRSNGCTHTCCTTTMLNSNTAFQHATHTTLQQDRPCWKLTNSLTSYKALRASTQRVHELEVAVEWWVMWLL